MTLALKRTIDLAVAAPALIILSPVMLFVGVAVAIKLGMPVLFRQVRPGKYGKPFTMLKFWTMTDARAADGTLLPDSDRLPPFGRWLRSTSVHEPPELWNVLRGDMSLVGPRPLLMHYLPLYSARQARRQEVRPGVTGWAQVNGRNALGWEEKLEMDVWYIDNWGPGLDLRILVATFRSLVRREGIAGEGSPTMTEFKGSREMTDPRSSQPD